MIRSPAYCRRAWARFLRRQGCTITEISQVLGLTEYEAAAHCRRLPKSRRRDTGLAQGATADPASIPENPEKESYP